MRANDRWSGPKHHGAARPRQAPWQRFTQDAFWLADVYVSAGKPRHALWLLRWGRELAVEKELVDEVDRFDATLAELRME